MIFGSDPDVSYHRKVTIVQGDEFSDSITYYVEYTFENLKTTRDVRVYFIESFSSFKYFQIINISTLNDKFNFPDLTLHGTDLRGYIVIPREGEQKTISYNLIIYKYKPTFNVESRDRFY